MSIIIIANPKSGRYNPKKLAKVQKILNSRFGETSMVLTEYSGHAKEIAKNSNKKIVIAAGGDGLINEVAQGAIESDKLFSALCFGSVNVFCREYGLGLNPIKTAKKIDIETFKYAPVGYIGSRIFLTMAGFGFDAQTVKEVNRWRIVNIYMLNELLHIIQGWLILVHNRFPKFNLFLNGTKKEAYHIIVSLGEYYAGNFKLGKIQKGKLNIFLVSKKGFMPIFTTLMSIFLGFGFRQPCHTAELIKITGISSCQIDGEYVDLSCSSTFLKIKPDGVKLIS